MKVKCKNCGATITNNDYKCPYCGGMNYIGARKKYFRDLNKIKDDLEDLDDIPVESYKKEASTQIKRIIKTLLISLIIIAIIYGIVTLFSYFREKSYETNLANPKDQLIWDRNNFPMLNEWYEAGEYDKLLDFSYELYGKDPIYTFYNWEHYDFLYIYESYISAMEEKKIIDTRDDDSIYSVTLAILGGLEICYNLDNNDLDEDEIAILEAYKPDMESLLFHTLKFTEEEALNLYKQVSRDGYLDYITTEEYAEIVLERLE